MKQKHSLTKTVSKSLIAFSFAALSILAISPTPTPANATPTTPNNEDTCLQEATAPEYYFWVSTPRGNDESDNPVGNKRIARILINSDFTGGTISEKVIDAPIIVKGEEIYHSFGDIAVVQDYASVYGIEFSLNEDPTHILKYDQESGTQIWSKTLKSDDNSGIFDKSHSKIGGFNSLSVGPHNELVFGTYRSPDIFVAHPEKVPKDDGKPVPVEKLNIKFPKVGDTDINSAGDFLVLPDGSLLGFGKVKDKNNEKSYGVLVKWKINNDLEVSKEDAPRGIVIGKTIDAAYGVGRVGGHILYIPNSSVTNGKLTIKDLDLSKAKEMPENPAIDAVPLLDTREFQVDGFKYSPFGASSSGDAGQASSEFKLIVKTVFSDAEKKADGTSKYPSGRLRDEDQAIAYSSDACGAKFAPALHTSGNKPGLQDEDHHEFVVAGTKHKLIEYLTYDPNWTPGTEPTAETMGFYDVSLSCVDGANKNIPVDQLNLTSKKASSVITIPQKGHNTGPITCTFTNTPANRPRPRLPLTGAETTPWQILGGIIVLGVLAAYPLARRMKTESKTK